jgi:iron complex transport system ATP-binding protein
MKIGVKNLYFSYNSHPVLKDVNFALDQGQVLSILGVNGAGKSTLLKCLNRILKPQKGAVLVEGEDLLLMQQNHIAKRIGYVPQQHPESGLTVFEAVLLGRKPHIQWSMKTRDYETAEIIIQQLGLTHLAMRQVNTLSGGELQKVVMARALAQSPEILLLDEPTSNLDLKNQLEVMGLIRHIVQTKRISAVVAIHDLNMAVRFSDSFLFLKDQSIHSFATKEQLSSEMIEQVYEVRVALREVEGQTMVVPL